MTWISTWAVPATGTLLVTGTAAFAVARKSQYDRVLDVLAYLSAGDVEESRHSLGAFIASHAPVVDEAEKSLLIRRLFLVLWAFQRVDAVRSSLPRLAKGPRELLKVATEDWVSYWSSRLDDTLDRLDLPRHDTASRGGLDRLAKAWKT